MSADDTLYEPIVKPDKTVGESQADEKEAFREAVRRIRRSLLRKKALAEAST